MKQIKYRGQTEVALDEYLVEDESDLPAEAEIGSIAYTADENSRWRMGLDGQWVQIGIVEPE